MADGSVRRVSARIDPKQFAALVTPAGGEVLEPGNDLSQPGGGPGLGAWLQGFRLAPDDLQRMEEAGVDLNKLRRFLRDGIGDQIGFHMHDAPRLLDSDLSGLFGADEGAALDRPGDAGAVRVRGVVGVHPGEGSRRSWTSTWRNWTSSSCSSGRS